MLEVLVLNNIALSPHHQPLTPNQPDLQAPSGQIHRPKYLTLLDLRTDLLAVKVGLLPNFGLE